MKAPLSLITVCQEALCFRADFDAPAAAGLLPSTGLRAGRTSPERRPSAGGAEVETPRRARGLIFFGCNRRGREPVPRLSPFEFLRATLIPRPRENGSLGTVP